jgi:anti-sigma B factor antagonist
VLIDLEGLTFMDSTGLACLIAADRDAKADGHLLHLRGVQGQVQMLFRLTGVDERFTFEA